MLSQEQIENIKKQILSQLEKSELQNKEEVAQGILSMDSEQLKEFLRKNNLVKQDSDSNCIFCSIVSKEISSYIIQENEQAIAVLEINPISKGHSLIIPKTHSEKIPKEIYEFTKEMSEKLKKTLKPKKIISKNSSLFGHEIVNILPVYKDESFNSQRKQSNPKELQELQKKLEIKQETKKQKEKPLPKSFTSSEEETPSEETHWLPKRIP